MLATAEPSTAPAVAEPASPYDAYHAFLFEVARVVRELRRRSAQDAYFNLGTPIDEEEYQHFSNVSAFFALNDFGVTEENVEEMRRASCGEIIDRAAMHLYEELHGVESDYRDVRRRERERLTGHKATKLRWDTWRTGGVTFDPRDQSVSGQRASENTTAPPIVLGLDAPQENVLAIEQIEALPRLLSEILSERDSKLLLDHYINHRSYKELAREIVNADPALSVDPKGFEKAMQRVSVYLKRARDRAAKRLPACYGALAEEVAA